MTDICAIVILYRSHHSFIEAEYNTSIYDVMANNMFLGCKQGFVLKREMVWK